MLNDTIVAPATAMINQAISIIRLSGESAYEIINKAFNKTIHKKSKTNVVYGYIKDNEQLVDEVILICYISPHSFTGEDLIEINCHGGIFVTQKIIKLLIKNGARFAQKGEFTKRAFLNGKINTVQADSINDLIFSTNEISAQIAIKNIEGKNVKQIANLRNDILDIIANIEVNIDYPEYDGIGEITVEQINKKILILIDKIMQIIYNSKIGQVINNGINTVIIGKPNVGKSSLLNALLNEEKAIVSEYAGTTRDIVEGKITISNISLNLIDTAGIHQTTDFIEQKGIDKTNQQIKKADLLLLVFDISKPFDRDDIKLLELANDTNSVIILNKTDLKEIKINLDDDLLANKCIVEISVKNNEVNKLIEVIDQKFYNEQLFKSDNLILFNLNHISLLERVENSLQNAYNISVAHNPVDIINIDLKEAWELLGQILGEQYEVNILDEMFSRYCLGK